MTIPRFWTDPKSGANYSFGDKLPSSDFNAFLAGWRNIDYAIERNQALTYPGLETISGTLFSACAIDDQFDQILLLSDVTASTSVFCLKLTPSGQQDSTRTVSGEPAGGWTTTSGCITSDGAGTIVIGGTTVNASTKKVAVATDGGNFTTQDVNASGAGVGVTALAYEANGGLFIAGLNGGTTATTIETSPDGVTWTGRTNANTNAISRIATDGNGTVVAISSASTNQAVRSTDGGATWSAVTLPATAVWTGITYSPGLGKWFVTNGTNSASSGTGSTWDSITMSAALVLLGSTGNLVIGQRSTGDLYVSEDGEEFARVGTGVSIGAISANNLWVTSTGIVALVNDGSDSEVQISSLYHV